MGSISHGVNEATDLRRGEIEFVNLRRMLDNHFRETAKMAHLFGERLQSTPSLLLSLSWRLCQTTRDGYVRS
jgi:hypothetical protein